MESDHKRAVEACIAPVKMQDGDVALKEEQFSDNKPPFHTRIIVAEEESTPSANINSPKSTNTQKFILEKEKRQLLL